jgi:hypothetical protein
LARFDFPFSRRLHLTLATGQRYSRGDLTFNPNLSDWMMGWPIGWSEPELDAEKYWYTMRDTTYCYDYDKKRCGAPDGS